MATQLLRASAFHACPDDLSRNKMMFWKILYVELSLVLHMDIVEKSDLLPVNKNSWSFYYTENFFSGSRSENLLIDNKSAPISSTIEFVWQNKLHWCMASVISDLEIGSLNPCSDWENSSNEQSITDDQPESSKHRTTLF